MSQITLFRTFDRHLCLEFIDGFGHKRIQLSCAPTLCLTLNVWPLWLNRKAPNICYILLFCFLNNICLHSLLLVWPIIPNSDVNVNVKHTGILALNWHAKVEYKRLLFRFLKVIQQLFTFINRIFFRFHDKHVLRHKPFDTWMIYM